VSVTAEMDEAAVLVAIEALNRGMEPALRINIGNGCKRIINSIGPHLFFEGRQHDFLIWSRHTVSLDHVTTDT
jgi:hypothetical protein